MYRSVRAGKIVLIGKFGRRGRSISSKVLNAPNWEIEKLKLLIFVASRVFENLK